MKILNLKPPELYSETMSQKTSLGTEAHSCNPSYLESRFEVSPDKKLARPYLNKAAKHGGRHWLIPAVYEAIGGESQQ
jgi:hypothetical protein